MDWLWWVGIALLFAVVEIVSLGLVLIMFAGGALAGAVANAVGAPVWAQIVVFAAVAGLLLVALRPWLLRRLRSRMPLVETNVAAQLGRPAVVVADVGPFGGRIKLGGEVWSARADREDGRYLVGSEVQVVRIDGATAVVGPAPAPPPPATPGTPHNKENA
jgi:membrane protein implicated in regulation of membrane protease activity